MTDDGSPPPTPDQSPDPDDPMPEIPASLRDARVVAVLGGVVYATVVLSWILSNGVSIVTQDPSSALFWTGYAVGGMVLTAAVPLYLLGRLSLITPSIATVWFLGDTVFQWAFGTHLHPLSSYLIVWPLLAGIALGAGLVEALLRTGIDRGTGRFGLRAVV